MPVIEIYRGDLFAATTQCVVNTINCGASTEGFAKPAMGAGIAKRFKELFPDMYREYKKLCQFNHPHRLRPGKLWLWRKSTPWWVLNFPTKDAWADKSKLEWIEAGLQNFVATYEQRGIQSITFPQLGCNNGGLDWETEVRPLMERYLNQTRIPVYIVIR